MYKVAICDDDRTAIDILEPIVTNCFSTRGLDVDLECFLSAEALIHSMSKATSYDLLFLDIDMPLISGFNLAEKISGANKSCEIVFVSSHDSFVFNSFKYRPLRFIRKENVSQEIDEAVRAFLNTGLTASKNYIVIQSGAKSFKLSPDRIVYIESNDKMINIHFIDNKVFDVRFKLSEIEKLLADYNFIRIHKGYLVNSEYIFKFEGMSIELDTGDNLPVSKYRVSDAKDCFEKFVMGW